MDYTTVQIDNLVKLAMKYGDFTKLEGIKDVCMGSAMMALQMYITCDNGDVIQLIYEFDSRKIYATLVGLHCNNDAHIPVCRDEIARKELIDNLMSNVSVPVLSSDPTSSHMEFPGYAFLNRGHVVYYLEYVYTDTQVATHAFEGLGIATHAFKDFIVAIHAFKGLINDVLCKHKDGVLLDIANVKVDRLSPKEITEKWVLC